MIRLKRRTFLKGCAASAVVLMSPLPGHRAIAAASTDPRTLESLFRSPPDSARARTWWHWMNGNVSEVGITRDLEAMKEAGLGGFQLFQISGMPKGPVDFQGAEHTRLLKHAAAEARRLGLEFEMHNCAGWTSSGGPWITPELSMQQVVWTETYADGGQRLEIDLPRPFAKRDYYRDACVIAFPSLQGEAQAMRDLLRRLTSSSGPVDRTALDHSNIEGGLTLSPGADNTPGYLLLEFEQPFTARSVALFAKAAATGPGGGPRGSGPDCLLETSDDGVSFRPVHDFVSRRVVIDDSEADCPAIANFDAVTARFFRLSVRSATRVIDIKLAASSRIGQWTAKANYKSLTGKIIPGVTSAAPVSSDYAVNDGMVISPATVVDLSGRMDSNGRLAWDAPEGNWTILRLGSTTVGIENHPATDGGAGLECDKFSKEAIEFHFERFFGEMLPTLQAMSKDVVVGALIDSYEVGFQNWTPDFPEEFEERQGYSLLPFVATMTGRIVGSVETSERFLWDMRRTQADMMADNYYGRFAELCREHDMISFAEPYSGGPYEEMQAGSRVDVPMGEFWSAGSQSLLDETNLTLVSSIAHVNGKRIVAAESFTGQMVNAKWQEYPFGLKAHGDWIYTVGVNRFVFHRFAHQPHPDAAPGMTMGGVGSHFDRTNTWYTRAQSWFTYLARCQGMLQEGLYVADVAYFIGEDAPLINPSPRELNPALPEGCACDTINSEAVFQRMDVAEGRIVLPDGMSYGMLLLKDQATMTVPMLARLRDLVSRGMCLIGPKPERTPGLAGYPGADAELKSIADSLWGDIDGEAVKEGRFGEGRVFWGLSFDDIYRRLGLARDFACTAATGDAAIHYIHRKSGDADFYFITNHKRRAEELVCSFRIDGRQPELWDPVSGTITAAPVFEHGGGVTRMPIRLGPTASLFVVFRQATPGITYTSLAKDGTEIWNCENHPVPAPGRYPDVVDDFTLSLWLKPETDVSSMGFGNANMAIYPPAGGVVYGPGHAACGLTAGRSEVIVYERSEGAPAAVLSVQKPVSGWTHLAVVYAQGAPAVYINGERAAEGKASGKTIHPGLSEALLGDDALFYQGDMSEPVLTSRVLNDAEIRALAAAGAPAPEPPPAIEARGDAGLLIWQNGSYRLRSADGKAQTIDVAELPVPARIETPWTVSFPAGTGAPRSIELPQLMSLHQHELDGVKYFSGTAAYTNRFTLAANALQGDKRLYLDLGRVEVLARVLVNGEDLGIYWCPPHRIDITGAARAGDNRLEVQVTNLWPNRLIGDEQLPPENEYENSRIKAFPEWYLRGEPKPAGGRITFAANQHYAKDSPLLASGLLGPVVLRTAVAKTVDG